MKRAYETVLGVPERIVVPAQYEPDCLFQAFLSGISTFEASGAGKNPLPDAYLSGAFAVLVDRVKRSRQAQAPHCLTAFFNYYQNRMPQQSKDKYRAYVTSFAR